MAESARATGAERRATGDWQRVRAGVVRSRLACAALTLLVLLASSAVYAPLIANDQPYYLRGVDYGSCEAALRRLEPQAAEFARLVALTPEEFLRQRRAGSMQTLREAVTAEGDGLTHVVRNMRPYQEDGLLYESMTGGLLDNLEGNIQHTVGLALSGKREASVAGAAEVQRQAAEIAERLKLASSGSARLKLRERVHWPLFESLGALEVSGMALWTVLLLAPLARRLWGRTRRGVRWFELLALFALAFPLVWAALFDAPGPVPRAGWKAALGSGDVVASRVVFAPLAFGFDETHSEESHAPPSWSSAARRARHPAESASGSRELVPQAPPIEVRPGEPDASSPLRHPLGTDTHGRDVLARLLWGGRVSLSIGLASALLIVLIGTSVGALAGFLGGWVDAVLSRLIEVLVCIPSFFLVLSVMAFTDPRRLSPLAAMVIVIAGVGWTGVARLARAEILRLRELDYVLAARALGYGQARILARHVLPNALAPVLVAGSFVVGTAMLVESALSYLGLGVQQPSASWGSLIGESSRAQHWWIQLFPGLAIFLAVSCFNLLGEAVRDALDPRASP